MNLFLAHIPFLFIKNIEKFYHDAFRLMVLFVIIVFVLTIPNG